MRRQDVSIEMLATFGVVLVGFAFLAPPATLLEYGAQAVVLTGLLLSVFDPIRRRLSFVVGLSAVFVGVACVMAVRSEFGLEAMMALVMVAGLWGDRFRASGTRQPTEA